MIGAVEQRGIDIFGAALGLMVAAPMLAVAAIALGGAIAACGDVNRNVMCNPNPFLSSVHDEVLRAAQDISDHLTPRTRAYHEIWLDGEKLQTPATPPGP